MRRRRFIAALGGGASLGLGGLLAYRASRTRSLSVASVETYDAAVRLHRHGPRGRDVRPVNSLDPDEAEAVRAALDGGYETADPPSWLSDFRDRVAFVRRDGSVYRLADDFPRIVVTARPVSGEASDLAVADPDRFREVVGRHVEADDVLARARLDGVVDRDPDERVLDFFETYDAARVDGRVYRFSVERRDAGAPYSLTAERVPAEAVRRERSIALSAVPARTRERLREAMGEDRTNTVGLVDPDPDLVTRLRAVGRLRADDRTYRVDAWSLAHLPLSVSASVAEAGVGFKDPGRLTLVLENAGDRSVDFHSGSPEPFGTLRFAPADGGRRRYLYPTTERSSSLWSIRGDHGPPSETEIGGGDRLAVQYAVGGDAVGVPPGRYVVDGQVGTGTGYRNGAFPFRVTLEID